ncbi:hypothetical protein [Pseudoalteromonas sp. TB13]|uniref:hypothetical protein n=1 Tax=Pseudoalteromonas sp. RB2-MNA-CIBAN-0110 TaxID=3140439 RepID=UPI00111178B8|nr:hypothetical protein [Pseudoalteromonas sp. TB13]
MWVVLGLIANSFVTPMGVIGYVGAIFYLFKAFEVVSPNEDSTEVNVKKLNEVTKELSELEKT